MEDRTIKPGNNMHCDGFMPVGSICTALYEEYIVLRVTYKWSVVYMYCYLHIKVVTCD